MRDRHLRLSDAERERATAELGEHYVQGRLTVEEHSERLDRVWAARTRGELGPVFADLPGGTPAPPGVVAAGRGWRPPARRRRGLPAPLVALVVLLATVTVLTHLPLVLVGLGVWLLLARKGHCAPPHRRARWS